MPARASTSPIPPAAQAWLDARGGLAGVLDALRAPLAPRAPWAPRSAAADELAEARELLGYWERRARQLPRWAVIRRREAREMAGRWRARVRDAEERRYGRGLLGAASMYAIERRAPASVMHRGRQAGKVVVYTAVTAVMAMVLVFVAVVAAVAAALL